jgi:hypothetical protein
MLRALSHFNAQGAAARARSRHRLPALVRVRCGVWRSQGDNPTHQRLLEQGAASLSDDQLLELALGAPHGRLRTPAAACGPAAGRVGSQGLSALFGDSASRLARAGRGTRRWCVAQAWIELVRRSIGERLRHPHCKQVALDGHRRHLPEQRPRRRWQRQLWTMTTTTTTTMRTTTRGPESEGSRL